jgi:hypothetical protein
MRRTLFLLGSFAALATVAAIAAGSALVHAESKRGNVVLELFTSQGCSSCPPADALLAQLGKERGVIALSFAVDYWDYLGWSDTLGSSANSERQRSYAHARGDGRVYTPQMVVDGVIHVNGSSEAAVEMAMRNAKERLKDVRVPVRMHADGDTLMIEIDAAPSSSAQRAGTVWLAVAKQEATVNITRGENRGKRITYHRPVREISPVGMWTGEAMTLRLPLKDLKLMGGDCLVALLQVESVGAILGAAEFHQL